MNTQIFQQTQVLRQELENKLQFGITDTAILDLCDEYKLTVDVLPSTTLCAHVKESGERIVCYGEIGRAHV